LPLEYQVYQEYQEFTKNTRNTHEIASFGKMELE